MFWPGPCGRAAVDAYLGPFGGDTRGRRGRGVAGIHRVSPMSVSEVSKEGRVERRCFRVQSRWVGVRWAFCLLGKGELGLYSRACVPLHWASTRPEITSRTVPHIRASVVKKQVTGTKTGWTREPVEFQIRLANRPSGTVSPARQWWCSGWVDGMRRGKKQEAAGTETGFITHVGAVRVYIGIQKHPNTHPTLPRVASALSRPAVQGLL